MVLRPHLLRQPGQHAQQEAAHAVQRFAAEQAVVAAVVHQHEAPQQEQAETGGRGRDDPGQTLSIPVNHVPEPGDRRDDRQELQRTAEIAGGGIAIRDLALAGLPLSLGEHVQP
jgi:hypothetical protein